MIYLRVLINNQEETAILDPGANISLIDSNLVKELKTVSDNKPINIRTLGSNAKSLGRVLLTLTIGKITKKVHAHIMRDLAFKMLIGIDEAALFDLKLDLKSGQVTQHGVKVPREEVCGYTGTITQSPPVHNSENIIQPDRDARTQLYPAEGNSSPGNITANTNPAEYMTQEPRLDRILLQYNTKLQQRDPQKLYTVPEVQHRLLTMTDIPVASCPHRQTMDKREKINSIILELLEEGKIRRSTAPYASPAFLVGKKDGEVRMVIDYRRLNDITLVEPYPIPRMDDLLDGIDDPKVFSVIDLKGAYHHIRMHEEDIPKTAFVTTDGHFEWLVMPFGLKNAPATFARYMNSVLRNYRLKSTRSYFDDILVATKDLESHLRALEELFEALAKENLTVNTKKCHFLQDKVNYLGITINNEGIRSQQDKVKAIRQMPNPKNRHELMRFLGMVNFYHKFIPNYAIHAVPLHNLLKKDKPWKWSEDCNVAMDKLKSLLSEDYILIPFNRGRKTILYTDASGVGIGAVLKQELDGVERPVAFYSKRLSSAQTRYTTSEQEALAIVKAIEHWNYYLDGHKFIIRTDHKPLTWLKTITDKNRRLFNWSMKLSVHDYKVEYLPGETNVEADALSRAPVVNLVTLQEVRNALSNSEDQTPVNAYQVDDIIYVDIDGKRKLFVPESLRRTIVEQAHKQFGHLGVKATSNLIQIRFHWPGILKDIQNMINDCDTCSRCKNYEAPRKGELRQIPPASKPLELISMDTVSGFKDYGSLKTHMTIVVDHATRYAWTFASQKITDDQAINCIRQIMQAQGPIMNLLTDRYPAYFSRRLDRFLNRNDINHKFTTPYHPQGNGFCERINRTILNKLRCLKDENPRKSWVTLLKTATAQYNNTIHSVSGYPPSFLLLGRTTDKYLNENNNFPSVDQARKEAIERSQQLHERNKAYYDKGTRPINITVGDYVYVRTPLQVNRKKLDPPYEGPWKILSQVSTTIFEVDKYDHQNHKESTHYHCSMLKKYKGPKD